MKALWAKTNLYLLTLAGIAVIIYLVLTWDTMPVGQKALGFFVLGMVLHEWEETRFPGGFFELMAKKFGIGSFTEEQAGLAHGSVVIAIIFFAFIPFLFWNQAHWLAGIPVILGFFESLIHVVGIKIHNLPHPYSPGMATALLCLLPAAICIIVFAMTDVAAWQWILIVVCYFAIFAAMELSVMRAFGMAPKDMAAKAKQILSEKKNA